MTTTAVLAGRPAREIRLPALAPSLCADLDPGGPTPRERLRALERLARAGAPAGARLGPVLPGINDRFGDLRRAAAAVAACGGRWLLVEAGDLRPADRSRILSLVRRRRPGLVRRYLAFFADGGRLPRTWRDQVLRMAALVRSERGLGAASPPGAEVGAEGQLGLPFGLRAGAPAG